MDMIDLGALKMLALFGFILALATIDIVRTRREIARDRAKAEAEARSANRPTHD